MVDTNAKRKKGGEVAGRESKWSWPADKPVGRTRDLGERPICFPFAKIATVGQFALLSKQAQMAR